MENMPHLYVYINSHLQLPPALALPPAQERESRATASLWRPGF